MLMGRYFIKTKFNHPWSTVYIKKSVRLTVLEVEFGSSTESPFFSIYHGWYFFIKLFNFSFSFCVEDRLNCAINDEQKNKWMKSFGGLQWSNDTINIPIRSSASMAIDSILNKEENIC